MQKSLYPDGFTEREVITYYTRIAPVSDYLRTNVFVAPSGIFSEKYLRWTIETIGADRVLFATDYPFIPPPTGARAFLDTAPLDPTGRAAIGSANWARIQSRIQR